MNEQAFLRTDIKNISVGQQRIDGKVYLFGDNPLQLAACTVQPPESDTISHPKLIVGCFRDAVHPFLSSGIHASKFIMANFHTIETVEAIICPQPYKTFGIFINGIDQQSGQSVGHDDITECVIPGLQFHTTSQIY